MTVTAPTSTVTPLDLYHSTLIPSEVHEAQEAVDQALTETLSPRERAVSGYSALSKHIKAEGLLNRAKGFYIRKFITITALIALTWVGTVLLRDSALVLLVAPVLGILTAQYGFLAHEAAHQQVFGSPKTNKWVGIVMGIQS